MERKKMDDVTESTLWMPMRDGVRLHGLLFRPVDRHEPLPVVMMRNPYNGITEVPMWDELCVGLAQQGYAVINQDVRGTCRSEGLFRPFHQEGPDGYDSVEWVAAQSWCDGRVGLWGISYLGVCVMQAAALRPPHLIAGAAHFTASDYHDHWVYENGIPNDLFVNEWVEGFVRDARRRSEQGVGPQQLPPLDRYAKDDKRPLFYDEWGEHFRFDAFWQGVDLQSRYGEMAVPMLMTGGWFDGFAMGTLNNFAGLQAGGSGRARTGSRLVMTPRCHQPWSADVIRFPQAPEEPLEMDVAWWDEQFGDGARSTVAPVRLYVMAPPVQGSADEGFWIDAEQWPIKSRERIQFALASHAGGGKLLVREGISEGPPDRFLYDPANPVPTLGGALICHDPAHPAGIADQASLAGRADVVVYSTPELTEELAVVGRVSMVFRAASSAPDPWFAVKLTVARADGTVLNYLDRMISAALPQGSRLMPAPYEPGSITEYCLVLGETALILSPGMSLRVEISSSNSPRFMPRGGEVAVQTLFHDESNPSWLVVESVAAAELRKDRVVD